MLFRPSVNRVSAEYQHGCQYTDPQTSGFSQFFVIFNRSQELSLSPFNGELEMVYDQKASLSIFCHTAKGPEQPWTLSP